MQNLPLMSHHHSYLTARSTKESVRGWVDLCLSMEAKEGPNKEIWILSNCISHLPLASQPHCWHAAVASVNTANSRIRAQTAQTLCAGNWLLQSTPWICLTSDCVGLFKSDGGLRAPIPWTDCIDVNLTASVLRCRATV